MWFDLFATRRESKAGRANENENETGRERQEGPKRSKARVREQVRKRDVGGLGPSVGEEMPGLIEGETRN